MALSLTRYSYCRSPANLVIRLHSCHNKLHNFFSPLSHLSLFGRTSVTRLLPIFSAFFIYCFSFSFQNNIAILATVCNAISQVVAFYLLQISAPLFITVFADPLLTIAFQVDFWACNTHAHTNTRIFMFLCCYYNFLCSPTSEWQIKTAKRRLWLHFVAIVVVYFSALQTPLLIYCISSLLTWRLWANCECDVAHSLHSQVLPAFC